MNGFKRFCIIVFSLAGMLCLAALALPWIGPWQREAASLMGLTVYFSIVEVVFCITALGLLILFFRALFTRSNKKSIIVTSVDGGQITVSRDAIASQAAHIIEEDGMFTAVRVDVDTRKRSKIKVHARVLPSTSVDVTARGNELHNRLATGLAAVCGNNVSSISLDFEEPEEVTSTVSYAPAAYDPAYETAQAALPQALPSEPEPASEIRLDMATFHAPETPTEAEAEQEE